MLFLFFFFKQKTAYEMRISDWSSDVCSSDLAAAEPAIGDIAERPAPLRADLDRPAAIVTRRQVRIGQRRHRLEQHALAVDGGAEALGARVEIGRASLRERVCQYV